MFLLILDLVYKDNLGSKNFLILEIRLDRLDFMSFA
jgi:hypothetical protein